MTTAPLYRAARVLVVDDESRVLLLRWIDPAGGRPVWFTPGGGIQDGETAASAAARELREETGIEVSSVGVCLMHLVTRSPRVVREEEHFLVRYDGQPLGVAPLPDPGTDGQRWWSLAELDGSDELFHPRNVAQLLRLALNGGAAEPISVEYELE